MAVTGGQVEQCPRFQQEYPMVADIVDYLELFLSRRSPKPRPNCCSHRIFDSVGRSIMTVSRSGRSTPSLNMSTAQTISSSPAWSFSSEMVRGALVGPE